MKRIALDSNILIYFAGVERGPGDADKVTLCTRFIQRLVKEAVPIVSTQALGEVFNVTQKAGFDRETAHESVRHASSLFTIVAHGNEDFFAALELATAHRLQIWDSLILAVASAAKCDYLLSEDMQDGFSWRGVTVLNPFSDQAPHLLFG